MSAPSGPNSRVPATPFSNIRATPFSHIPCHLPPPAQERDERRPSGPTPAPVRGNRCFGLVCRPKHRFLGAVKGLGYLPLTYKSNVFLVFRTRYPSSPNCKTPKPQCVHVCLCVSVCMFVCLCVGARALNRRLLHTYTFRRTKMFVYT